MVTAENLAPVLQVDRLSYYIPLWRGYLVRQPAGALRILDSTSFELYSGEMLVLVGESGSGKSSLAKTILHLASPGFGRVVYRGQDLAQLRGESLRAVRRKLQLVFQDARAALNPIMPAREVLAEALAPGERIRPNERILELAELVEFSPALLSCTPGALSDEQCRRLGLARALAAEPEVIVYDAPVRPDADQAGLGMLRLLRSLQSSLSLSCLFLDRSPSPAYRYADRVGVMYAGRLIELAPQEELSRHPLHPYSQALLAATPGIRGLPGDKVLRLPGESPRPGNLPGGCRFHPRCRYVQPVCLEADAEWRQASPGHWVACHMV